jgi:hypothetical protein
MKKILIILVAMFSATLYAQTISENEKAGLLLMREEEKMARDVYQALNEKWNQVPFTHISESESYHMAQVKQLLDKFKLSDPVTRNADARGVFDNMSLKKLHDELVSSGNISLEAAFRAGAKVEEVDIRDLKNELAKATDPDIKSTYSYLIRASEHHLQAFTRNLSRLGITYTPEVLSREEFDAIINGSKTGRMGLGKNCCANTGNKSGMSQGKNACNY